MTSAAGLLDLITGRFRPAPPAPPPSDALADYDAKISKIGDVLASLTGKDHDVTERLCILKAKRDDLLDRVAVGDTEAEHEVIAAEGEIGAAELELDHLATMRVRQETKRENLRQQRAKAAAEHNAARLRSAALDELRIGAELHAVAESFAAKLGEFIAADISCNQLAAIAREPQGSDIVSRLTCALSHALMPTLTRITGLGTSITLDVTSERRHLGFADIARRPFTPKAAQPEDINA
jgi:hypothetical protein